MRVRTYIYSIIALLASLTMTVRAEERPFLCELGVQGGYAYYVGDAEPHIFMSGDATAGLHFRYKFDRRWALQTKVSWQQIKGHNAIWQNRERNIVSPTDTIWKNQMLNFDVMAEFNFFRFGARNEFDSRIKPFTPYIFLGIGVGLYGGPDSLSVHHPMSRVAAYIPFGIGFKWKFSKRCGLNIAWQHNIYINIYIIISIPTWSLISLSQGKR